MLILSLLDGSEICRIKFPEMHYAKDHFAVSPDGTAVYDIICLMETFYLHKIDLESKKSTTIKLHKELRGIDDVICDKDGVPCLLASHYETVAGKYISINGVRCVYLDSPNPADTCDWKAKWHHDFPDIARFFWGDSETILTKNLIRYQTVTKQKRPLCAEGEDLKQFCPYPIMYPVRSQDGRHIILVYQNMDVIFDPVTWKIVALYAKNFYHGDLINNEYWLCTPKGIQRKPFPCFETIPPIKPTFLADIAHSTGR